MCWEVGPGLSEPRKILIKLFLYSHKLKKKPNCIVNTQDRSDVKLSETNNKGDRTVVFCWFTRTLQGLFLLSLTVVLWLIVCILETFGVFLIL